MFGPVGVADVLHERQTGTGERPGGPERHATDAGRGGPARQPGHVPLGPGRGTSGTDGHGRPSHGRRVLQHEPGGRGGRCRGGKGGREAADDRATATAAAQARDASAAVAAHRRPVRRPRHRPADIQRRARVRVAAWQAVRRARREGPTADRGATAQAAGTPAGGGRHAVLADGFAGRGRRQEGQKRQKGQKEQKRQ